MFNEDTILKFIDRYQELLLFFLKNENILIKDFSFFKKNSAIKFEKKQIDKNINNVALLIKKNAVNYPDKIAISCDGRVFNYRDILKKSEYISNILKSYRIKKMQSVAVIISRNEELVISMLAVMSIYAVYLPLDPDMPIERLRFIIKDADPKCIITNLTDEKFNAIQIGDLITKINLIKLNKIDYDKKYKFKNNYYLDSKDHLPAYLLYTSGTTGNPKGVLQQHKTLINLFYEQLRESKDSEALIIAQIANSLFDVSLQEITFALLSGSNLCIIPDNLKL